MNQIIDGSFLRIEIIPRLNMFDVFEFQLREKLAYYSDQIRWADCLTLTVHLRITDIELFRWFRQISVQIKPLYESLLSGARCKLHIRFKQRLSLILRDNASCIRRLGNNPVINADKK